MKTRLLLVTLYCLLSFNSFSQQLTSKFLIGGVWNSDTTYDKHLIVANFIDSTNAVMHLQQIGDINLTYQLDTVSNLDLIHFTGTYKTEIFSMYFLVKIVDNNTLKTQGGYNISKPTKWDNNETFQNTGNMIRVKEN